LKIAECRINNQFRAGARAALPIALGYLPVGIAFGVLARQAGLPLLDITLMSLFVYAGASQFIAVEMISRGIGGWPILLTTFFVNFRHFLMSSSLCLYFSKHSLRTLGLLSAQLTDESFALAMSDPSKIVNRPQYLFGLQATSQLAWVGGSLLGGLFAGLIDSQGFGLAFALPGLFICLLILQIRSLPHFWVVIAAGIFSLFFKGVLPGNWYVVVAALLASGCGILIESAKGK
jgi:4-azaleucine resistance transporter AzlC